MKTLEQLIEEDINKIADPLFERYDPLAVSVIVHTGSGPCGSSRCQEGKNTDFKSLSVAQDFADCVAQTLRNCRWHVQCELLAYLAKRFGILTPELRAVLAEFNGQEWMSEIIDHTMTIEPDAVCADGQDAGDCADNAAQA